MDQLLVEMVDIAKSFPGVRALENAQFDLRPGEVHGLVGENGAGKSTLMKILAGIYRRDAGVIRVRGEDQEITSPRAAQDLGISIIHQELNLMGHLTVAQNVFIGREPRRGILLDEKALNRKTAKLFEDLHIHAGSAYPSVPACRGPAADGRDREGPVLQLGRPGHGRADGNPHRHRDRRAVPDHPPPPRAGPRDRPHLPPPRRAQADHRPGHGHARRALHQDGQHGRGDDPGDHQHDGRPDRLRGDAGAAGAARSDGHARGPAPQPRAAGPGHQLPAAPGRDPRDRGSRRRRPHGGGPRDLRGGHAGVRRDPRQRRAGDDPDAGRCRPPRDRLPLRGPQALRARARHGRRGRMPSWHPSDGSPIDSAGSRRQATRQKADRSSSARWRSRPRASPSG